MPNTKEIIASFMNKKNKESLGELVKVNEKEEKKEKIPDSLKVNNNFEEGAKKNDKALLLARKIINGSILILILVSFLLFTFFLLIKIMPSFLGLIKKIFLAIIGS